MTQWRSCTSKKILSPVDPLTSGFVTWASVVDICWFCYPVCICSTSPTSSNTFWCLFSNQFLFSVGSFSCTDSRWVVCEFSLELELPRSLAIRISMSTWPNLRQEDTKMIVGKFLPTGLKSEDEANKIMADLSNIKKCRKILSFF